MKPREQIMTDVSVGYGGLESAASQLRSSQEEMSSQLQQLQSMIGGLVDGDFRTQLASPRFQESYQQWTSGAQNMIEGLDGMASFLDQTVSGFQELDTNLSQGASGLA
jgi:WXG100 family type VII secretion target